MHTEHHRRRSNLGSSFPRPVSTYVSLSVEEAADDECQESSTTVSTTCSECADTAAPVCEGTGSEPSFADDELGTVLEVTAAVQVRSSQDYQVVC